MATATTALQPAAINAPASTVAVGGAGARLPSIDALRGFVMVVMLLDHVRETWFLHHQYPTAWFSRLKARRKDVAWLKYL